MDAASLQQLPDEVFDQALVYHGFTDYMRDYEAVVYITAAPRTGVAAAYRRDRFRYCVQVACQSTVLPRVWRCSLDDRLVEYETGVDETRQRTVDRRVQPPMADRWSVRRRGCRDGPNGVGVAAHPGAFAALRGEHVRLAGICVTPAQVVVQGAGPTGQPSWSEHSD